MGIFATSKREGLFMPADQGSSVFTIEELSGYLKISKSTLYKLAQDGNIPGQKVGKHWRFHKDAIDRWLQQRGPKPSSPR
jgi:excisionase family DNA binding protein